MKSSRASERLRRAERLVSTAVFAEVYERGMRFPGRTMVLWWHPRAAAGLRLGVVAGRKVGGAVQRSRARRRLREVFRRNRNVLVGDGDVVLVARSAVVNAPWDEVVRDFMSLTERAGLRRA